MIKRYIEKDEYYPFCTLENKGDEYSTVLELTEKELIDYHRVMNEFRVWQERLRSKLQKFKAA